MSQPAIKIIEFKKFNLPHPPLSPMEEARAAKAMAYKKHLPYIYAGLAFLAVSVGYYFIIGLMAF